MHDCLKGRRSVWHLDLVTQNAMAAEILGDLLHALGEDRAAELMSYFADINELYGLALLEGRASDDQLTHLLEINKDLRRCYKASHLAQTDTFERLFVPADDWKHAYRLLH